MPTQSIRLDFSHGRLFLIWIPIGLLLSIAVIVSASYGYTPDPLSFLNGSLWDLSTQKDDWLTLSIKTMILAVPVCSLIGIIIRSSTITGIYISEDKTVVHQSQLTQSYPTADITNLQYASISNGDYKVSFRLGGKAISFNIGNYQREKLDSMLSAAKRNETPAKQPHQTISTSSESNETETVKIDSLDHRLLEAINQTKESKPSYQKVIFLLITLVLFMGAGGYRWGLSYTILIVVALFIHELGHVLAMKVFKYRNISMLFLPFFGAIATGTPKKRDATKNALISIAGPGFGIVVGTACSLAYIYTPNDHLYHFAVVSFLLNGFNLIPFKPLDGGLYLNAVLFSRFPLGQLFFDLIACAGIGFVAFHFESYIFGAIALFILFGTPTRYTTARLAKRLRSDERFTGDQLDITSIQLLRKELNQAIPATIDNGKGNSKILSSSLSNLWDEIKMEHPKVYVSVLLMLLYFATIAAIPFLMGFAKGVAQALQ